MFLIMYLFIGGGVGFRGNFEDILILSIIKVFLIVWFKVFFGEVVMFSIDGGNQFLYDKISIFFGKDVLYNFQVVNLKRSNFGIELVVDLVWFDDDEE